MKKSLILILLIALSTTNLYSQVSFVNGYFIDNSGTKVECLIKDKGWERNPELFEYRETIKGDVLKKRISEIQSFAILDGVKFVRASVEMDMSSDYLEKLSKVKEPEFENKTVLLRVLVEGSGSLYQYYGEGVNRFFYKKGDEYIQLIHKRYKIEKTLHGFKYEYSIGVNNYFHSQLFVNFNCLNKEVTSFTRIDYTRKKLEKFFEEFNVCYDPNYQIKTKKKNNSADLNLVLTPGISLNSFKISSSVDNLFDHEFGSTANFRVGLEGGLVMPFNNKKWSVLIEPTYRYYGADVYEETNRVTGGSYLLDVNYSSLEVPVGFRYRMFLSEKNSLFVNALYVMDFHLDSSVDIVRSDGSTFKSFNLLSQPNLALGVGGQIKKKFSVELRYQSTRQILKDDSSWSGEYSSTSIIFGWKLF
ncbi:outer membrane beta-barrel protein [Reichenbachiella versicolor]|uniref:outer membrane beta-barrel protein n=1 Tax=Reichenbachiella versicolor TaxID=1821036 RepID=UPI000D6E2F48|nr:outer membrane beta-barrel protein [Reichenbachiella versicolor]